MRKLGLSEEEIAELVQADAAIDKGEKMDFDLSAEQLKEAKKFIKADRKPTVYSLDNTEGKRNRKKNDTKALIIAEITAFLNKNSKIQAENVEILNAERQIAFKIGENAYELTLTQKRKPKK